MYEYNKSVKKIRGESTKSCKKPTKTGELGDLLVGEEVERRPARAILERYFGSRFEPGESARVANVRVVLLGAYLTMDDARTTMHILVYSNTVLVHNK